MIKTLTSTKITPEEFLEMEDAVSYELVDGQLVERNMSTLSCMVEGLVSGRRPTANPDLEREAADSGGGVMQMIAASEHVHEEIQVDRMESAKDRCPRVVGGGSRGRIRS